MSTDMKLSEMYAFHLRVLNLSGFCPANLQPATARRFVMSAIPMVMFVSFLWGHIVYEYEHASDLLRAAGDLPNLLIQTFSLLKVINLWYNHKGVSRVLLSMDDPIWVRGPQLTLCMKYCIQFFALSYSMLPFIVAILWLMYPYVNGKEDFEFALNIEVPAMLRSSIVVHLTHSLIVVVMGSQAVAEAAKDAMLWTLMAHVNVQLIILKETLTNIGYDDRPKADGKNLKLIEPKNSLLKNTFIAMSNMIAIIYKHDTRVLYADSEMLKGKPMSGDDNNTKNDLVRCMMHHRRILTFVEDFESTFTWVIFIQLFIAAIVICTCVLKVVNVTFGSVEFIFTLIFAFGMLMEIIFYCYFGNNITEESLQLSNALYHCKWYTQDVRFKKCMVIFMERTKRPVEIFAGKLLPLTLQTFVNIIKSSYSYYAVFKGLK